MIEKDSDEISIDLVQQMIRKEKQHLVSASQYISLHALLSSQLYISLMKMRRVDVCLSRALG